MDELHKYRSMALETLAAALRDLPEHEADYLLDDAIRSVKGLPARPADTLPYQRLFKLPHQKPPSAVATLKPILPDVIEDVWTALGDTCDRYELNTPLRVAHFLAQTAHESAAYTRLVENLNYSEKALLRTWPKRFDDVRAKAYAHQPERIANYVYADRMGNGPEASGDGWRYRGRGIIQITGRDKYLLLSQELGVDFLAEPDRLAELPYAVLSAGWYWRERNINQCCDADDLHQVTQAVNGGLHGIKERQRYLLTAKAALKILRV